MRKLNTEKRAGILGVICPIIRYCIPVRPFGYLDSRQSVFFEKLPTGFRPPDYPVLGLANCGYAHSSEELLDRFSIERPFQDEVVAHSLLHLLGQLINNFRRGLWKRLSRSGELFGAMVEGVLGRKGRRLQWGA